MRENKTTTSYMMHMDSSLKENLQAIAKTNKVSLSKLISTILTIYVANFDYENQENVFDSYFNNINSPLSKNTDSIDFYKEVISNLLSQNKQLISIINDLRKDCESKQSLFDYATKIASLTDELRMSTALDENNSNE